MGLIIAAGGGANHDILDGSVHPDTVIGTVARGALIFGSATPKWTRLVLGTAGKVLTSDGTDAAWNAPAPTWLQVTGKLIEKDRTIYAPDYVNDWIPVMYFSDRLYPYGATIVHLSIRTDQNSTYTALFKEVDAANNIYGTVHSLATSGSKYAEVEDGSITAPEIAVNRWLYLTVPSTNVDWLYLNIIAQIKDS